MVLETHASRTASSHELDALCINAIRFLSVDAVQKANSGHPGLPMGAAPMAYVLWTRFLKHNPADPQWFDRDRFVLSAGHGSMLLYSLLHLTGYDLSLADVQHFRQLGSKTPGHPERGVTPGVEATTGPLGQGFANGVGMAIAEAHLAARYNRPGFEMVGHHTYAIVSDGDLMEGVAAEAASLAGHLRLGKLIYLYDNNHVSLSATTNLTFTEDVARRFDAYGWHTLSVDDGNDMEEIERALRAAQAEPDRPSLILVSTHLGYGSPHKQDTFAAHGSPLGEEEVALTKKNLGWPLEPAFYVPDEARRHFLQALERGKNEQAAWELRYAAYARAFPDAAAELRHAIDGTLPDAWDAELPAFSASPKGMATRVALGTAMRATAPRIASLMGGSADLDPSTYTTLTDMGDFENPLSVPEGTQGAAGGKWDYAGRNLHFGVREHAMGAILNGLAAHGGILPFGATFLVFSDYMRPPIRLAALMGLHVIYAFTHDSIGLGEDGPTHQPVEHLLGLRAIPGLWVIRPADASETAAAWRLAVEQQDHPVALVLARQNVPVLDAARYPQIRRGVAAGGYVLAETPQHAQPDVILVATGSEVHLALAARERLAAERVQARVVSLPSWTLFKAQPPEYRNEVLPPGIPLVAIEAGSPLGWQPYVGPRIDAIGVDRFGESAPGETVMREYGFTVENVCEHVQRVLGRKQEVR
ncbi:MAG: transketolase [Pirellulales bacterium]